MENLEQMNDRDDMNHYLDQFSKAQLAEMAQTLGYKFPKSATRKAIQKEIVELYAFKVLNRMMAQRSFKHPILDYTVDDLSTAIEGREEDGTVEWEHIDARDYLRRGNDGSC